MKGKAVNATMQWSFSIQKSFPLLLAIVVIALVHIFIPVQRIIAQCLSKGSPSKTKIRSQTPGKKLVQKPRDAGSFVTGLN